ncbi:MAG: hypothetical protein K2P17_02485 [Helicobacteraceae bacterium]|nr:hypothetical protein [Helicobacteraceae bacterium]
MKFLKWQRFYKVEKPSLQFLTILLYDAFGKAYDSYSKIKDKDIIALHLGFYLASWRIYHGISQLLKKDYKIHAKSC